MTFKQESWLYQPKSLILSIEVKVITHFSFYLKIQLKISPGSNASLNHFYILAIILIFSFLSPDLLR